MEEPIIDMNLWYTAPQALEKLSANSGGKKINPRYLRYLALNGMVEEYFVSDRIRLYKRTNIDGYTVEKRGVKAARVKRQSAADKRIAAGRGKSSPKKAKNSSAA